MTKEYDYTCANCNGLVARPNTMYGWGGSFCDCKEPKKPEPVQTTTFMTKEQTNGEDELEKYVYFSGDTYVVDVLDVKKFISKTISKEKEKMIAILEKERTEWATQGGDYDVANAIEKCINLLQK